MAATSRSMHWRGDPARLTKLDYTQRLVAAISLLLLRQRDAVGIVRFDDQLRTVLPPRARRIQWQRVLGSLGEAGAGQASDALPALEAAARLIRRPGMVLLFSDLLMDAEPVARTLRHLRAAGHDVTVFHVMDPAERDLLAGGDAIFVDPESGLEVPVTVADVRDLYRGTVADAISEWRRLCASAGATYELVLTDTPFGIPLRRAFAARQRLP